MEILALQGKNLTELCRCCLTTSNYMSKFTSEDEKAIMLSSILNFEVEIDENTPQFICECCVRLLETSYEFQQLLKKSTKLLQSVVLHEQGKEVESILMESEETTESTQTNPIEVIYLEEATHYDKSSKVSQRSHPRLPKIDHSLVEEAIKKTHEEFTNNTACVQCNFVAANGRALRMHMKFAHKELKLRWCSTCNTLVDDLTEHTVKNHQSNQLTCEFCQKSFTYRSHLTEHLKCHSNERPYKCHLCEKGEEKGFIAGSHLRSHLVKVHGDRSFEGNLCYKCDSCNFIYFYAPALEEHIKGHMVDENTLWVSRNYCNRCEKEVPDPSVHVQQFHQSATKETPSLCTVCGKTFKTASKLRLHMRDHLGNFPYSCKFCPKKTATRQQIVVHERTHTGEKPHICCFCGSAFAQSSVLQTHLKLHTGKPFKCDICKKTFCRQVQLRCHMRQHTGEKPYLCGTCGNGFKQKSHLEEHMRVHTDDRRFKCEHCGRCFTKKFSLKSHINIHLGFKPYKCDQCSFSTRQNSSLTLHKMRHLKKVDKSPETL